MPDPVIVERDGGVATVRLNRPDRHNALSAEMVDALIDVIAGLDADGATRCLVLTGAGPSFCAGGDVKAMYAGEGMFGGSSAEMHQGFRNGIQRIPRLFNEIDVPVVAAVNGPAIGAGLDMAAMCDVRIASEKATFAESFLRLGLVSGDGGAWYLPRVIGHARATEMTLTAASIDAVRAAEWGLVSRVVAPDDLVGEVMSIAAAIAALPPRSVRLAKRLLRQSSRSDLPSALDLAATYQSIVQHTSDQREAVAAFVERRAPRYEGR
jgi:2-(1,2-epoxy-1,2-dihydrophenyl)acetyl-CoA isomerase